MEHTTILDGWLIKSPPERKTSGPFKLFKAKWRRRWFVLHEKQASEALPGTRAALDYYSNVKLQKKLGFIDLEHCEEVLCKLDTAFYKNVFSVRTKHKNRDRCYYLASESEEEMMKWVECLCLALGLKENEESSAVTRPSVEPGYSAPPAQSSPVPAQHEGQVSPIVPHKTNRVSNPTLADLQSDGRLALPSQQHEQPAAVVSQAHQANHTTTHDTTNPQLPSHDRSEGYIPLEDCFTGKSKSKSNESLSKQGEHRGSRDSIPPEPPPAPPVKQGKKEHFNPLDPSLYDMPTKSYVNLDDNENVYKIPARSGVGGEMSPAVYKVFKSESYEEEGVYKMPRSLTADSGDEEGVYKMPRDFGKPHSPTQNYDTENIYKIPPPAGHTGSMMYPGGVWEPGQGDQQEGWYDSPPMHAPPRPVRENSSRAPSGDSQYYNRGASQHFSRTSEQLDLYDIPKHLGQGPGVPLDYRAVSTLGRLSAQDLYDAPKPRRKTLSENNILESIVPPPAKMDGGNGQPPMREGRYENLPNEIADEDYRSRTRSARKSSHPRPPSSNTNSYLLDNTYDIPPSKHMHDSEKLVQSPPPPKPCQPHSYINAPSDREPPPPVPTSHGQPPFTHADGFYMPMATSGDKMDPVRASMLAGAGHVAPELYTDMMGMSLQHQDLYSTPSSNMSNRPVNPSVHDVVPPPSKTKAFIDPKGPLDKEAYIFPTATHRTRSFKRPMPHSDEVALPTRRTVIGGRLEEPASSDDESSSSGTHDKSGDSLNYRPPHPMFGTPHLPPKVGSLNCTPPAPKSSSGEVQYLDLALEASSDPDKSPLSSRGAVPGNVSPTDYKEIDFVKTKALNEMQKDVESKRKSSERSVDE